MPKTATRAGNRLMDRPEYASKQKPLTATAETTVFDAVLDMSKKNFGSAVALHSVRQILGVLHKRNVMTQLSS